MKEEFKLSIIRYITGQADETEAAEVRQWIKAKPENEDYYFQLYEAWHTSLYAEKDVIDVDGAYARFAVKNYRSKSIARSLTTWAKYAAAAVILLIGAWMFFKSRGNKPAETLVELNIPRGLTRKLILPDGSVVWINSGSTVTYSRSFGKTNREVFLSGEAYFDIAETDLNIPFLVKTDKFTIRDIGTVFNVKAYPDEDVFETTVVEGKVSVEGKLTKGSEARSEVFLEANQVLQIAMQSGQLERLASKPVPDPVKVSQVTASQLLEYNGWKDDVLVFENDSFEDISRTLERRYNVRIVFEDEGLKNYRYSGTFKQVSEIAKVLEVIRENTPVKYRTENGLITIVRSAN